jgi:hypothetical protein
MTHAQAARHLGCAAGTIATRLSRARQRLRARLTKHDLSRAGLLPEALAPKAVSAVPPSLLADTGRAAVAFAADPAGSVGILPPTVAALMKGVCKAMLMQKVRMLVLTLTAVAAVTSAGVLTYRALAAPPLATSEDQRAPLPASPATADGLPSPRPAPPASAPVAEEVDSPHSYRTANFIVTAPTRRCAQLVAEAAEQQRRLQARRWLGKELADWPEPCRVTVAIPPVRLQPGAAPETAGCFTSFRFEKGALVAQEMHLQTSLERILAKLLPHEVTHTVFASSFRAPVPRWADEGGAMLAEDEDEQQRHKLSVGELCAHPSRIIPLRRLLPMPDYPKEVAAFYAESYALTRFLVERKDRSTFLAFVKQGMRDGWDKAAQAQYDFRGVEDLEHTWRMELPRPEAAGDSQPEADGSPARIPNSPLPLMVLARMTSENRLRVRMPTTAYVPVTTYVPAPKWEEPRTSYEVQTTERIEIHPAADVEAFGMDGRRIPLKNLANLLRDERPVLLSANGRKVDPFYLQLIKEGTVILVLPPLKPPPLRKGPVPDLPPQRGN